MKSATTDSERPAALLIIVSSVFFVDMLVYGIVVPVLPDLADRAHLGLAHTGVVFAGYGVLYLVATPVAGRLVDRYGPRPMLLGGGAVLVVSTLTLGYADTAGVLLAGRVLQGAAAAASWVAGYAALADGFGREDRGKAAGTAAIGTALGLLLGPPLGGVLADHAGPTAPFLVVSVLAAATLLAVAAVVGAKTCGEEQAEPRTRLRGGVVHVILPWLAAAATAGLLLGSIESAVPMDLSRRLDASGVAVGWLFAMTAAAFALASVTGGMVSDRHGRAPVLCAGWVLACAALPALGVIETPLGAAIPLAVIGFGLGAMVSTVMPALADAFDDVGTTRFGTAAAYYNMCFGAGLAGGPALAGWVSEIESFPAATVVVAVSAALLGALALAIGIGNSRQLRMNGEVWASAK